MKEKQSDPLLPILKISYRFFGKICEKIKTPFLEKNLKKSRIGIPRTAYLSILTFIVFITAAAGFSIEILMFILKEIGRIEGEKFPAVVVLTSFIIVFLMILSFGFLYLVPYLKTYDRKIKIEQQLPFATNYMAAMAVAGVRTEMIFESLAQKKMKTIYKELSEEAKTLEIQVGLFGKDYPAAFQILAEETASPMFSDFAGGVRNTLVSGGSFQKYILSKRNEYKSLAVRRKEKYFQTLDMISEIYMIAFLAAPLFFMILLCAIMPLSGSKTNQMIFLTYRLVPFLGIFFLLTLEIINEKEDV